ncbi:hypothetical protein PGTUg99_031868 [Puccinia graminis f. sp. tritici]|uniref:Uncharacterized protein n=1 Tax=Puccinia graminis f. sp. tritici TaxID=56615 RepID=A0A5B0SK76_PUCGR|nr:hypothetical protein PGTUg99_031868 [Puccinia graminis f. sp. tritici]
MDCSRADHLHLQPRPRSTLKANLTNQATVRTVSTRAVFQAINQFIVFSRNRQSQIIYRTKTLQLAPRADSCTPSDHSNRLVSTLGPWITSQTTSSIESSIHHHPSTDSPKKKNHSESSALARVDCYYSLVDPTLSTHSHSFFRLFPTAIFIY